MGATRCPAKPSHLPALTSPLPLPLLLPQDCCGGPCGRVRRRAGPLFRPRGRREPRADRREFGAVGRQRLCQPARQGLVCGGQVSPAGALPSPSLAAVARWVDVLCARACTAPFMCPPPVVPWFGLMARRRAGLTPTCSTGDRSRACPGTTVRARMCLRALLSVVIARLLRLSGGGSVPDARRRSGEGRVSPLHPTLEPPPRRCVSDQASTSCGCCHTFCLLACIPVSLVVVGSDKGEKSAAPPILPSGDTEVGAPRRASDLVL